MWTANKMFMCNFLVEKLNARHSKVADKMNEISMSETVSSDAIRCCSDTLKQTALRIVLRY